MNPRPSRVWLACVPLALACGVLRTAGGPAAPAGGEEFVGRTEAAAIEVRARVTGYLVTVAFKDGAAVKQGDVLFEIDPRPYRIELERTEGVLARAEAHLRRVEGDYRRAKAVISSGGISREDYDRIAGDLGETSAEVRVARANRDAARANLDSTRVTAPVAGHVGRRLVAPGSLIRADETPLATVVAAAPMYVAFDVDERTALRLRRAQHEGKEGGGVAVGLADEEGFPRRGSLESADVRLDPDRKTLRLRAVLPNDDGFLVPGMSARVRLKGGEKQP